MAGLLEKPETETTPADPAAGPSVPVETPSEAPSEGVRLCASCAAPMAAGQDWCLECGNAQPGRLGARHGWRAALTVVAATGLLATGAVAAAYAALSSDAQRQASAPPAPAAQPTVTQPPAQTAPPPEPETPEIPAPSGGGDPLPEPPPFEDDFDVPPPPAPGPAPAPAPAPSGGTGGGGTAEPADPPIEVDRARTLDPEDRGGGEVTRPGRAIDGDSETFWRAPVGEDGLVNIGLVVSLEEAREIASATITSGTPGFTLTLYGSRSAEIPPDIVDTRWTRIRTTNDFGVEEKLKIDGRYRHVLLWITEQPADTIVGISDVELSE